MIAVHVLGLPAIKTELAVPPKSFPSKPASTEERATGASSSGPLHARAQTRLRDWNADTPVFLTTWGNVVHMFSDCSGTRGFRHVDEPDPEVHQARLRDPVCRNRRACRKCFDLWSPTAIDTFDGMLESFHGGHPVVPTVQESVRVPSSSGRLISSKGKFGRRPAPPQSKKGVKLARDQAEAAKLGLSLSQLKARRRAQQGQNRLATELTG